MCLWNVGAFDVFAPEVATGPVLVFCYPVRRFDYHQFVGQDQNDDLLLYVIQMNVRINSNTNTGAYILHEHYVVNCDEMARRTDELVTKVKDKLGLGEWASRISSEGYGKTGSQVKKETEP